MAKTRSVEVFGWEEQDGLGRAVASANSVATLAPLIPIECGLRKSDKVTASLPDSYDLFFLKDIMVSSVENLNGDVFTVAEIWNARNTPEDKPLNFEHKSSDIIGHIIGWEVVDDDKKAIANNTALSSLPEKIHLVTSSVIYKLWDEEDRAELIEATIAEIKEGTWSVSMECYFYGFDYLVKLADGTQKVVARNEDSAWLTKYLRAYGGEGIYKDEETGVEYGVARVLKNVTFSGKGLVRKPANPESEIFTEAAVTEPEPVVETVKSHLEINEMTEAELKVYKDRIAALEVERDALKASTTQAKVDALTADVAAKDTEIASLKTQLEAVKTTVTDVTAKLAVAETEAKTAKAELEKVAAEKQVDVRVAAIVEKGATEAVAKSLAAKFVALDDAAFTETLSIISASWTPAETKPAVATATQVIANATAVPAPALNVTATEPESAQAAMSDYFSQNLKIKA